MGVSTHEPLARPSPPMGWVGVGPIPQFPVGRRGTMLFKGCELPAQRVCQAPDGKPAAHNWEAIENVMDFFFLRFNLYV